MIGSEYDSNSVINITWCHSTFNVIEQSKFDWENESHFEWTLK